MEDVPTQSAFCSDMAAVQDQLQLVLPVLGKTAVLSDKLAVDPGRVDLFDLVQVAADLGFRELFDPRSQQPSPIQSHIHTFFPASAAFMHRRRLTSRSWVAASSGETRSSLASSGLMASRHSLILASSRPMMRRSWVELLRPIVSLNWSRVWRMGCRSLEEKLSDSARCWSRRYLVESVNCASARLHRVTP